ncbi:MAG: hypothetical protein QOG45_2323 [Chloroflexota bacterium]|nr:hypothetical protein [Chloroflexota bacterium]
MDGQRDRQRQQHRQRGPHPGRSQRQPRVTEGVEDGEVHQVDHVGEGAQQPDPPQVQQPEEPPVVPPHGDDEDGDQRRSLEGVANALLELRVADQEAEQQPGDTDGEPERAPSARGGRIVVEHGIPVHGERAAEQEGVDPGVGGHVGPIVPRMEGEHQDAPPGEHRRTDAQQDGELAAGPRQATPQEQEQDGEDEIEVLLDRQRPVDRRSGRPADPPPGLDHLVVAHVEDLRDDRVEPQRLAGDHSDEGEQGREAQDQVEGREQPQHTAEVEAPQADAARPLELPPQQGGDQESAQEEEDGDPELPGDPLTESEMGGDHDRDGDGAEAVEGRDRQVPGVDGGPHSALSHARAPAAA